MVLEEATSNSPDTDQQFNAVPQSDVDIYDGQNTSSSLKPHIQVQGAPQPLYVAASDLPRVAILGTPNWKKIIPVLQQRCDNARGMLKRPLRQEEANAICQSLMHTIRIGQYGPWVGGGIAAIFITRGWRTMRFPGGWSPIPAGEKHPVRFFGFRGAPSRYAWQSLRIASYASLWTIAATIFFVSNGMTTSMVKDARDPRLVDYNRAMAVEAQKRKSRTMEEARNQVHTTQQETFEQRQQRIRVQEMAQDGKTPQTSQYDDASPTGGMFAADTKDTGVDEFMNAVRSDEPSNKPRYGGFSGQTTQPVNTRASTSSREDDDFFGSSSPNSVRQHTEANPPPQPSASPQSNSAQPGSAWDRLRQQAIQEGRSKK